MSDTPPTPATPPQGSTPPSSDPPAGGAPATPFYESFQDASLKTNPRLQRLASVEDMARSLVNAESRLGVPVDQLIRLPTDPKDEKAMREVYTKLGLPDKPEGYGIKLDATASDADKAMLNDMLGVAHKAGTPPDQVKALVAWWQSKGAEFQQQQTAQAEQARAAGETELKTAWGAAYDTKSKEIGRLARDLGGPELAAELDAGKLGSHPQLAKMLGAMLDKMAEPGAPGGRSGEAAGGLDTPLTSAQATAKARELEAHPAFRDPKHAQHKTIVAQRNDMLRMASGVKQ
ncbi:hypothetical protein [Caulobacter sp. S45]|uniref:hypothetical protein n=1 Tax=Caulobacter sp. S45 TaxID=1641861 RepID=UPI001576289F|nr:hypothetical protein [Caulobacter sp. S45]